MSVVAWSAIGVLGLLVVIFFGLYRRGVQDSVQLTNFIILILLEQKEREYQEAVLLKFVRGARYHSPAILAAMVSAGLSAIAKKRAEATMRPNSERLWALNQTTKR